MSPNLTVVSTEDTAIRRLADELLQLQEAEKTETQYLRTSLLRLTNKLNAEMRYFECERDLILSQARARLGMPLSELTRRVLDELKGREMSQS